MGYNEEQRLQAINSCQILDTPTSREFDDITKLASLVCETPIALISIVDKNRQWFKSKIGIQIGETPRNISFCTHAIQEKNPFIISDASSDSRFKENPLVIDNPHIRFYAGIPLMVDDFPIGTLCVIDTKPRILNETQVNILTILAQQVSDQIHRWKTQIILDSQKVLISEGSRLAALREMAGGLAHEVNNPLAIIHAKASLIEKISNQDQNQNQNLLIAENARSISKIVIRISKIITALKKFSSEQKQISDEKIAFGSIISEVLSFCGEKIKNSNVTFLMNESCKDLVIRGNTVLLSQVFLNLIQNAFDAVECNEERWIRVDAKIENDTTIISIENSGQPIPSDIQNKLFQPFFTTKPVGKGTGLGLSISSGIIRSHNGTISYNTASPHPSFVISLPN